MRESPWTHDLAWSFWNEAGGRDVCVGDLRMKLGRASSCVSCRCLNNYCQEQHTSSPIAFVAFTSYLASSPSSPSLGRVPPPPSSSSLSPSPSCVVLWTEETFSSLSCSLAVVACSPLGVFWWSPGPQKVFGKRRPKRLSDAASGVYQCRPKTLTEGLLVVLKN